MNTIEQKDNSPLWTVHYNIVSDSKWVGTGWEFFDDKESAEQCFNAQRNKGNCPTLRQFHISDIKHLGAVHRL